MSALSTEAGLLNLLEGIRLSGPSTLLLTSGDVTVEGSDCDEGGMKMRSESDESGIVEVSGDVRGIVGSGDYERETTVRSSDGEGGVKECADYDCISSEIDGNGERRNGGSSKSDSSHNANQQHSHAHCSSSSSSNNNNNNSNSNINSDSSSSIYISNNKCRVEEVTITETQGTERKSHSDISVVSSSENIEIGCESRNSGKECISKYTAHEVEKGVGRKEGKEKKEKDVEGDEVSRYEERKAIKESYKQKQQKGQNSNKDGNKLGGKSSGLDANSDDFRVGGMLGRGKGMKAGFQTSQVRGLYDDDEEEEGVGGEGGVMVGKVRRKGVIYFVPRSNGVTAAATVSAAAVTDPPLYQGDAGERGAGGGGSEDGLHTNVCTQAALSLSHPVQGRGGEGGGGGSGGAGEDEDVIGGEVPGLGFLSYIADSEDGVMRACALRTIVVSDNIVCSVLFYTTPHYTTLLVFCPYELNVHSIRLPENFRCSRTLHQPSAVIGYGRV